MERFSTLFSRERSWENLHLSPLVQVPCLKKAQTTDLGSVPLSTFCVCTGLKIMAISRWSANFFSFSSFRLSPSCRGWWPPACTCFCTCCMNFCCFVPFLFFRPKVLSCQSNKFGSICWRWTYCMCSYRPVCRGCCCCIEVMSVRRAGGTDIHWNFVCLPQWPSPFSFAPSSCSGQVPFLVAFLCNNKFNNLKIKFESAQLFIINDCWTGWLWSRL